MAQIVITKPGALTAGDRRKLRNAGIVCIQAENPQDVRFIQPDGPELAPHDLLYAAMLGVCQHDWGKKKFAETTLLLLKAARTNAEREDGDA